ncbi:MAG: hypothetical protein HXY34_05390 [Candidatus Thorarchaeota archaeon]|nr:hypothetical protein [Candidatus Thorarchaeota archaeon]
MEHECSQWERLAGEFAESDKFYQAANQYKQAAACYLDKVVEMTRKAAENYHIFAEASAESDDHKTAATAYFEAATQYKQVSEFDTALTLFENSADQALEAGLTETAAQAYLWAAYSCHKLNNSDYFLTCAENMAKLYSQAADKALEEGKAERAMIDLSLAAIGLSTIQMSADARERIEKAKRIVDKTRWEWLPVLLSFSEALADNRLDDAEDLLKSFNAEETIREVMGACLNILEERERAQKRKA